MYNVLVGGAAGDGIDTVVSVFERALKRSGSCVFTVRDFMSRIRGGHNFMQVRFGANPVATHMAALDALVAMNDETIELHAERLREKGVVLCDAASKTRDARAIRVDMAGIAKTLGNPRTAGSVAIGAVLKLFGEDPAFAKRELETAMSGDVLATNLKALDAGYAAVEKRFPAEKGNFANHMLLSGNEALALGALAAGLRFYSAYPMSPSTSIMNYLNRKKEEAGIVVEQAEDEIAAANMALGAFYAGARAMVGTSGGGFCLMVEALGFAGIAEIPIVMVDVQRPGPATGFPTRTEQADLKFVISASQGEFPRMVIALRDHADAFYQTARALDIADRYQMPVILLSDQYLGDSSATVPLFDLSRVRPLPGMENAGGDPEEYLRYRLTRDGISPRLIPGKTDALVAIDSDEHDERGVITESAEMRKKMVDKRMAKLSLLEAELIEPEFFGGDACSTLLVGFGSTRNALAEAVRILNEKYPGEFGALVFGDIWPLPTAEIKKRAARAKRTINVEQNATGQLASLLRDCAGVECGESLLKYDGRQLGFEEIVARFSDTRETEVRS